MILTNTWEMRLKIYCPSKNNKEIRFLMKDREGPGIILMRGILIPDFFRAGSGREISRHRPHQPPLKPGGWPVLAWRGSRGTGERKAFGYCRFMNGHRDLRLPEILGE